MGEISVVEHVGTGLEVHLKDEVLIRLLLGFLKIQPAHEYHSDDE